MPRTVALARPGRRALPTRAALRRPPRAYVVYSGTVTNAGNVATDAVVEVAGPTSGSGFFVTNATTAETVRVNLAVGGGQTLVVDFASRTATISGVDQGDVFDHVNSQWWQLEPGANTVQASVPVTVKHRDAYR